MKVNIGIDTKTFIRFWLVVIGFILAGLLIYMARHGLLVILIALFIAVTLNPIVTRMTRRLPGKSRVPATVMTYIFVVLILGTIVTLIAPPVTRQIVNFVNTMPDTISQAVDSWGGLNEIIEHNGWVQYRDQFLSSLQDLSTSMVSNIGSSVISGAQSILQFITTVILVLALSLLMLVQGPKIMNSVWAYFSERKNTKRVERVVGKMSRTVSRYVLGQLTVAAVDGIVTSIVMFIFSFIFDFPTDIVIPIAMIVSIMSLIPMFGATIGAIIAAILISFSDFGAAIAFVIYFIIYQQIENNLVSPLVQSKSSKLPAIAIFMSVVVGVYMFGLLGGIIAIPVAGCIKILLDEFHQTKKLDKEDAEAKKIKIEA